MEMKFIELTDKFLQSLETNEVIKEYRIIRDRLLCDEDLKKEISVLHNMNLLDPDYSKHKSKIFKNSDYKRYLELENEIYYWTLEMTSYLKKIAKDDRHENN